MNKLYELIYHSGPHGDEMTTYNVKFNIENITLRDFIINVIDNNPQEWGEFYIYCKNKELEKLPYLAENEKYSKVCMEYKYGNFLGTNGHSELLDKYIDMNANNWANGGWSAMSFWINVKD